MGRCGGREPDGGDHGDKHSAHNALIPGATPLAPVEASPSALRCAPIGLHRTRGLEVRSSHTVGDLAVLEAAIAALEQGITIHDRDGRVVVCNPPAAGLLGLPLDEILGTRPRYESYDVRWASGEVVTAENGGVTQALRTGQAQLGRLVELRPHDGGPSKWLRVNFQPLTDGEEGPPWGVVSSFVEVEPPDAAPCASDVAPVALEVIPDAILAVDSRGLVVYANDAARALAADVPELTGAIEGTEQLRPVLFDRAQFESPTRDDSGDDDPIELSCAFERPDRRTRWLAARFRPAPAGAK